ncbi:hypothetical protein [Nitratidesulfovibrio liaohensis]|uniref:Response regulatory domain-containing protein n=1 Tax=Nitratidesulfovibrio liaohensis TaxID=2604158 RepID=A0ABY9QZ27_9BACT|nr:hypothetical protein [Nitratidesulfovibrio liaohensis]WMW64137.1 hypothetical protein KPS_002122 [Nitratidesulfovibrio liaohensis]
MLTGVFVLVVDRNPMSAFMCEWELRKRGAEAFVVRRVQDALPALDTHRFDFALVDVGTMENDADRDTLHESLTRNGVSSLLMTRRSQTCSEHQVSACALQDSLRLAAEAVSCIAYCVLSMGKQVTARFS